MIAYDNIEFKSNEEFSRYLLLKYLTIEFKKQSAENPSRSSEQMILSNINNLFGPNSIAVWLGERNFEFFCMYYLQDTFVAKPDNKNRNLADVHLEIWQEVQQMFIDDEWDKELFILPRGSAKSTIINKALTCHQHCYAKSKYTIVIGNKESDAIQFIGDTRKMLGNEYIIKSFGELIVESRDRTLNKQEIELSNDTKIQAYSWGSSVRGTNYDSTRPTLVILDDILSEKDILTENAKEKVVKKYYTEIEESGDNAVYRDGKKISPATKFVIIGTPLAPDDFINTVRQDSTFKVFHRKVVDFDIDEYFDNNEYWQLYKKILLNDKLSNDERTIELKNLYLKNYNEMQFPTLWEKYQCDDLAEKYFTKRTAFMQELMCDTENIGEKWFKSIRVMSPDEIEERNFTKTILQVDPASTTSRRSDYSAFTVGSESDNSFIYIRKGIIEKLSFNEYCQKVIELLKQYPDITHVVIEKNLYQGTDVLKIKELMFKDKRLIKRNVEFINEMQRQNKDEKISSIVDDVNAGRIIFNEKDKDYIKQVQDFSGQDYSLHDDAPDSLAECVKELRNMETISKIRVLDRELFGL